METLPKEIIERIICSENLSIRDVVNFSLTNRHHNLVVINCNIIWRKEYFKTWPHFVELFDDKFNCCWYAEVQYIYDLKRRTREILSMMASRFFKVNRALSKSNFTEWFELFHEKPQTYYYLIDDLISILDTNVPIQSIEVVPITTPGNQTLQYYAMKVLTYLRQLQLAKEWRSFIALPEKLQTLEKGIVFVGQWFQPYNAVWWQNIAREFDKLTEKVKEKLKMAHPNHPFFRVPKEQLEIWRNENIESNKYDRLRCIQIKHAITYELQSPFDSSFDNIFCKNKVLENTIGCAAVDFILLIMYESVARRLGVKFKPIIHSGRLYIRSMVSNNPLKRQHNNSDSCYYNGVLIQPLYLPASTTQQVVKHIVTEVEVKVPSSPLFSTNWIAVETLCSRLELLEVVSPFDVSIKQDLASLYMHYNMDTTSYTQALMQQKNQAPEQIQRIINILQQYQTDRNHGGSLFRKVESKVRPTNLKYAVGMVMKRHVIGFGWRMCVICDWDSVSSASDEDEELFYNVLFEDGSYEYLAQDELELPCSSLNFRLWAWRLTNIGWHFSHRFEAVFVPNADKEREYPADTAVRNMYNERFKPLV